MHIVGTSRKMPRVRGEMQPHREDDALCEHELVYWNRRLSTGCESPSLDPQENV